MKQIVLFYILLITLFSQSPSFHTARIADEMIQYKKARSNDNILSLNGNWEFKSASSNKWVEQTVPSTYKGQYQFIFRKTFKLDASHERKQTHLVINGIKDRARIKLNGAVIGTYNYQGAPYKIKIDPNKLNYQHTNKIELEISNIRDYDKSIPGKPLLDEARIYGGISSDIYLSFKNFRQFDIRSYDIDSKLLTLNLDKSLKDSIAFFRYDFLIDFLNSDLSRIRMFQFKQFGSRLANDSIKINISTLLRRRELFDLPENFFINITMTKSNRNSTFESRMIYEHVPILNLENYKVISKIEQNKSGDFITSFSEIESDVNKIIAAGFNTIYFPLDYPHPYYFELAKKNKLRILTGLPFKSSSYKQLQSTEATSFITNYVKNSDKKSNIILNFLGSKSETKEISNLYNLNYMDGNYLYLDANKISLIKPLQSKLKSFTGYLNSLNEEHQGKLIRDQIDSLDNRNYLVSYFSDFYTENPNITQKEIGDYYLNQSGFVSMNREEKKIYRILNARAKDQKEVVSESGTVIVKEEYAYIILGIFVLAIVVVGFRQAARLPETVKRTLIHAHGFFSDTRDRRIIYMGQTSFVLVLLILTISNLFASYMHYHRNNESIAIISNYLFEPAAAENFFSILNTPVKSLLFSSTIIFLLFVISVIFIKIISYFGKRHVNFRQCLTVSVWAFVPVIFLIVLSPFYFNTLEKRLYQDIISYIIIVVAAWSFLRWVNGARVILDVNRISVYLFFTFTMILIIALIWVALIYMRNFSAYNDYLMSLI